MQLGTQTWQLRRGEPFLYRTWDYETVLFDPESGDTHLLDTASFGVLNCFRPHPQSEEEIARQAARSLGVPCDERLALYISKLVRQLAAKGLVEAADGLQDVCV